MPSAAAMRETTMTRLPCATLSMSLPSILTFDNPFHAIGNAPHVLLDL
jgi:hypothetical protein